MEEGAGSSTAGEFVPIGDAPRGAGAWVRPLPKQLAIPAGEERTVPVHVDIPDDAGAGGWYAAVTFVAKDPRADAQVPIDLSYPVPLLLTVAGDFERDLRVELVPTDRWRWRGGRGEWIVELRNEGDVHEVLAGRVRLDGALSGASSRDMKPAILLPGEVRRQRLGFELRDAPDLLAGDVRIERDEGDRLAADAPRVVVLPWWLLVLAALAVAVIVWRLRTRREFHEESWESDEDDGPWGPSPPAG